MMNFASSLFSFLFLFLVIFLFLFYLSFSFFWREAPSKREEDRASPELTKKRPTQPTPSPMQTTAPQQSTRHTERQNEGCHSCLHGDLGEKEFNSALRSPAGAVCRRTKKKTGCDRDAAFAVGRATSKKKRTATPAEEL